MLLSAVSVLVVAQSSSEFPEGLMNNPVQAVDIAKRHLTCYWDKPLRPRKATHIFPLDYFPRGGRWGLYGNRYSTNHMNF